MRDNDESDIVIDADFDAEDDGTEAAINEILADMRRDIEAGDRFAKERADRRLARLQEKKRVEAREIRVPGAEIEAVAILMCRPELADTISARTIRQTMTDWRSREILLLLEKIERLHLMSMPDDQRQWILDTGRAGYRFLSTEDATKRLREIEERLAKNGPAVPS